MIRLTDVKFRWSPRHPPVLDIPDFRIETGEKVFLKGPSGSGKTTLLNLLAGIASPQSGRLEIDGSNIAELTGRRRDAFRADHLGVIFQMFNLVPYLSPVENVVLPSRFSDIRRTRAGASGAPATAEARRLLSHMGLRDGLADRRATTELSVGQQQRVAAARALIGQPRLLIADEPTSALDADTRGGFLDLLFAEIAKAGTTLLFVSHDSALEGRFDRVVPLHEINRAAAGAAAGADA